MDIRAWLCFTKYTFAIFNPYKNLLRHSIIVIWIGKVNLKNCVHPARRTTLIFNNKYYEEIIPKGGEFLGICYCFLKVAIHKQRGQLREEGGSKILNICPHGLWMTP